MPSMGLIVEPVVFNTIHKIFDLEKIMKIIYLVGNITGKKNMRNIALI